MKFLITNDDGYQSQGLATLAAVLADFGEVTVVAPMLDQSGKSQAVTLDRPLSLYQASNGFYYLNGTPADCVHVALTNLLTSPPDMIISGINHGANLGDDTLYSGTVGAATEGFLRNIPALAISLCNKHSIHWDTAAWGVRQFLEQHGEQLRQNPLLLNINIPDLPIADVKGMKTAHLGRRGPALAATEIRSPSGQPLYWIGGLGEANLEMGSDFLAIKEGYIAITPLTVDLTAHAQLNQVQSWLTL